MTSTRLDLAPDAALKERETGTRRTRLREFQAQLVERMHAASSSPQEQSSRLGVMIGNARWLLNLQEAGEIVTVGAVTPVPLTQDWYIGLTNIRGNLISVVDLARFLGMPSTPIEKESRIVAFAPGLAFNCGLLVSRVMGLRNVAEMSAEPVEGAAPWAAQAYRDRDNQSWTELTLSTIVQDPQFLQVGL
ncbi:MAG TPA: chemotaxis protein CheW [Noviherbaspirillum sp.]|jgi:twitching motility protein PilI|uniref:chemotaxis protein CheW n=1 Tax=Noviherbaspirillum sp. TaxID=1926288 RepID=UPI002F9485CC